MEVSSVSTEPSGQALAAFAIEFANVEVKHGGAGVVAVDGFLDMLFHVDRDILGKALWLPLSVNFTRDAPADLAVHRRVFRCKLNFGTEFNGIVCLAHSLDRLSPTADAALAGYAEHLRHPDSSPLR